VLVSFELADGALHVLAAARRIERGSDGRWYAGVELDVVDPADRVRLDRVLDLRFD
jgi:hypothetical protein